MIAAIRALHREVSAPAKFYGDKDSTQCAEDGHDWPCATIRLLDAGDPQANAVADSARSEAEKLDQEADRYGDRGGDPRSALYRRAADTIDRLTGRETRG